MPTREMKTRFKLEGEQAYKRAMTDAANAIKVLKSEQRLAAAEFEASGDAQEYAAEQARILAAEIEQQKKAVEAAEKAVKALTKNGVEENSKQMQTWKTKLNDAKSALKRMETQLNDTETELTDQKKATNNAKTAYENAEKKIKSLNDEEKLAEAQFKATGDKEAYAAEKTRILKEKIAAQEEAVAAAEAAIKSMTENGVDPASEEMVDWKNKLVTAKTKLATLQTQLNETEEELNDQKKATNNAKTAYENAEKKIKSLTDEEKLAEAQFKATGDKEQYAADKAGILKEKIAAQQEQVAAAEAAIKSMTENGVDPASEEMVDWKNKLVTAKTKLATLQTQLNETEEELNDQKKATNNAKTAYENAEKKIKSLTDEEKLAEAQFKATGDKEQYAADKAGILKEKIAAQQEQVAAAEAAIKSMTENGVDPASEEMVDWKNKLVTAKTKLATLQTQLNETEEELDDQKKAVNNAKTAYDNAQKKIKSLTDEEKLAEAQFKATGDKQQYAADKARILKQKLEEQKKAVEAAETAIKSLTENGVEPNSDEVVEWKNKLVQAKTGLYNLQRRLDQVGDEVGEETEAFGKAETGADDLKESIDKVGEGVDFQNVISSIDGITQTFEKVIRAASRAAKAVWEAGISAGQWADDLATAASEAGMDVETYQSWQYASRFIDTSVNDIINSWKDIDKELAKEGDALYEYMGSMAKAGIAVRTTTGQMRQGKEIFWDAVDYLHKISDEGTRAAEAARIFGQDWRKLNPLIEAGSKGYMEMAKEGMSVAVVSEKNVQALGAVDDAMQDFQAKFDTLKYDALAALAPTFESVAKAMGDAVNAFNQFEESEEGRKALSDLNAAVSGLISSFLGEDKGKGTFASIVNTAKEAVEALTGALNWMSENGEAVSGIITGLGIAYGTLKVAKPVLQFMELLNKTPLAKLTSLFGGGEAASGAAAVGANAAKKGASLAAKGIGAESVLDMGLGLAGTGVIAYSLEKAVEARQGDQSKLVDTAEHLAAATEGDKALKEAFEEFIKTQREMEEADYAYWGGKITDQEFMDIIDKANAASEAFLKMKDSEKVLDAYNTWRAGNAINDMDWILPEDWEELGLGATDGLADGIEKGLDDVDEAGAKTGETLAEAAKRVLDEHSPSRVFEIIGENAAVGLANGIYARGDEAIRAAKWLADSVTNIVQSALDIHSPSKKFEELGAFTGMGFAAGIEGSAAAVSRAVDHMIGATARQPAAAYAGVSLPAGGSIPGRITGAQAAGSGMVHVTMVLDEEVLGDVMAPIVNDKIGAKMQAVRR